MPSKRADLTSSTYFGTDWEHSLSLCAINAIVDFFHISCISTLQICTIYVINITITAEIEAVKEGRFHPLSR